MTNSPILPNKKLDMPPLGARSFFKVYLGLLVVLLFSIVVALCLGVVTIAPFDTFRIIFYQLCALNIQDITPPLPLAYLDIIWDLRLPRILMAVIAGSGLALCGTVMQASVQNPLADPYLLGISSGASLGATFSILLSGDHFGTLGIIFWAFAGALLATFLVMLLAGTGQSTSTAKIILAGTVVNALFFSLANFIIYISNNVQGIRSITFWNMGSLASAKWDHLLLPGTIVLLGCLYFLSQPRILNTLMLGEETAMTLGVDPGKVRRYYMIVSAMITAVIVSTCGTFAFVGLIIPHIIRSLIGSDHRRLIPSSILVGAIFLIWADTLARIILQSGELPIGIITSLIGAPFFMYLLMKQTFS